MTLFRVVTHCTTVSLFRSSPNHFNIHLNLIHLDLEEIGKGHLVRPKRRNKLIILKGVIRNKTIVSATSIAASYHRFIAETWVRFQTSQSGIIRRHIVTGHGTAMFREWQKEDYPK